MKHVAAILFAFLCACAGGPPTTYGQSVPMAPIRTMPRTWDSPATRDAPITTGQPGHFAPQKAPRGTDRRVLPPTREAGVWASDAPKASMSKGAPSILGVPLPVGDGLTTPDEQRFTQLCADLMDPAAKKVIGSRKLPKSVVQCLAAKQYFTCMIGLGKADLGAQKTGAFDPERGRIIDTTMKTAARFEKTMCPDDLPLDVIRLADAITAEADNTLRGNIQ